MTKPIERGVACALRAEHGTSVNELAELLCVSKSTVSLWVRDVEIADEHRERNRSRGAGTRADTWRRLSRERRRAYQLEGRERAREGDLLHQAGCMLYWAEGSKGRNTLTLTNSDRQMMRFVRVFLSESLGVADQDFLLRLNVYLGNGMTIGEIEDHWLGVLKLPRSTLRKHQINHFPTSSSGKKRSLPYGVCTLRVRRSTGLLQHIYGAIQEYAGFEEPRWLDGLY